MVLLPDAQAYTRPEGGSLLFGIREKKSLVSCPTKIPNDISQFIFSNDNGINDLAENAIGLPVSFPSFL